MNNLMIDLETHGNVPGCTILSIGAVFFDSKGVSEVGFYEVVNHASCIGIGLVDDADTVAWWDRQRPEAQVARNMSLNGEGVDIGVMFQHLEYYINKFSSSREVKVWGNGSDFDNAILAVAARKQGIELPWKFWNNRCFRTFKNTFKLPPIQREGVAHNALDDAVYQATIASTIMRGLEYGTVIAEAVNGGSRG